MHPFNVGLKPWQRVRALALVVETVAKLGDLVSELERRVRDEALTSAAQAATIIFDGVKANS